MKRVKVEEAALVLGISKQAVRKMIQDGKIGRITNVSKERNTYYLTDVMIKDYMKGGRR